MSGLLPLFGPVGPEMLIILLVLVLLFGANKIPKLARSTGEAMGEFKKGREEIEKELNEAADPDADMVEDVSELDDEELETEKESTN
ncbi:twin-arginine translocase TatA/TatE family subunit [Halonotius sp. F2-221B]|uniref:Sec-independent protein translocase subunit TatA/TatB n=1 Tax=Halonotius sp. F2-221B TaxID=2731620 RepID=UPI00398A849A